MQRNAYNGTVKAWPCTGLAARLVVLAAIAFSALTPLWAATATTPVSMGPVLTIDASQRFDISPAIYGMSWADESLATELKLPLHRWGGNHTSRYNWRIDVHNQGADWFFENVPAERLKPGSGDPAGLPATSSVNRFIERNRTRGSATLLTVPMAGWVAARRSIGSNHPYDCGFRQSLYGNQLASDRWDTDCGSGVRGDGSLVTGNNPQDTSTPVGPGFVTDWLRYLTTRYGTASGKGVRYVGLDNEPELWSTTHRDVRPQALGYDELRDRSVAHALAVKAADRGALTLGPSSWGWTGYFYSDLDTRTPQFWLHPPDRSAHGGVPLVPWYLQQMRLAHERGGQRLLDYLDLHFYPQAKGVRQDAATDPASNALRLRQTRALWDPSYVDESWINEPVALLPRMRNWVAQHYPGTQLALSEYNFGALDHISGALAQADVLGILGREGVGVAALWEPPTPTQPGAFAFRMYRNFDGRGGQFGSVGVRATSASPGDVSVFAARQGALGAMTVVLINKTERTLRSTLRIGQFTPTAAAQVWRYSAAVPSRIEKLTPVALSPGESWITLPPQSIQLLLIPGR